jgi:hypothetical protein
MPEEKRYMGFRAVAAEGVRVGLVTCLRCYATLLIDPMDKFDVQEKHDEWHKKIEGLKGPRRPTRYT